MEVRLFFGEGVFGSAMRAMSRSSSLSESSIINSFAIKNYVSSKFGLFIKFQKSNDIDIKALQILSSSNLT